MFRVHKITDSIFPRDFSLALNSCKETKQLLKNLQNEQIKNIKEHYKNQLITLQTPTEKEKLSKKIINLQEYFNEDPYTYAYNNNIDYALKPNEIKAIRKQVSSKFFKTSEEKTLINTLIKEKELKIITDAYNQEYESLLAQYPPKTEIVYEDTGKSLLFKEKYENNYEQYARDFNLEFTPTEELHFSPYAFIYQIDPYRKTSRIIIENEKIDSQWYSNSRFILDIVTDDKNKIETQVNMYKPKFDNLAFFLYKNCLYQADFNDFFTDEELIIKVKEKIYKEDKKFEQLRKQIELYETSNSRDENKRTREPIPEEVKFEVWRRDQGRCVKCGSQENLEFDHIIPFSKGGSSTARNIQLLCQNCNRHKSDKI